MTYRLAIEIGETHLRAAVAVGRDISPVPTGDETGGVPAVAIIGADGTIITGADAMTAPDGEFIADPLGSLGIQDAPATTGPVVGALLRHVVSLVADARGALPELVMLAHPDRWTGGQTAALRGAAEHLEVGAIELCSTGAAKSAFARVGGTDDLESIRVGAAILAAVLPPAGSNAPPEEVGPARLVTLEDLEGPLPARPPRHVFTYSGEGPVSVFEPTEAIDPIVAAPVASTPQPPPPPLSAPPAPVAASPIAAGYAEQPPPHNPPAQPVYPPTPRYPEKRDSRSTIALLTVIGVVIGAIAAVGYLLWDNQRGTETARSPTSSTSAEPSTQTSVVPPVTTAAPETSSTTELVASTTTEVATTTIPTTTMLVLPEPGVVALTADGIVIDRGSADEVELLFGTLSGEAITTVNDALGASERDSAWIAAERCADAEEERRLAWGDLVLVFADYGGAPPSFVQWEVRGDDNRPRSLRTLAGVGLGTSRAAIDTLFPEARQGAGSDGRVSVSWIENASRDRLSASLTGTGEADSVVIVLSAGDACRLG